MSRTPPEPASARQKTLDEVLRVVRGNRRGKPLQHLLFVGPRGAGKTTMLHAIAASIDAERTLHRDWIPLVLPEEAYCGIADLADLWTRLDEWLADRLGETATAAPDETAAQAAFLARLEAHGRRAVILLEGLGELFNALSDAGAEHRLRALLMDDDRVMLVASADRYVAAVASVDRPFFDFFRVFPLRNLERSEVFAALRSRATARGETAVLRAVEREPERIDVLRVLTGGEAWLVPAMHEVLRERPGGDPLGDLEHVLGTASPRFGDRLRALSVEQRRVFDRVARHFEPVTVGELAGVLRRPSNQVSTYLGRLVDAGVVEEASGGSGARKRYQVADRAFGLWYLARSSPAGRRRLARLVAIAATLFAVKKRRSHAGRAEADVEPAQRALAGATRSLLAAAKREAGALARSAEELAARDATGESAELCAVARAMADPAREDGLAPELRALAREARPRWLGP